MDFYETVRKFMDDEFKSAALNLEQGQDYSFPYKAALIAAIEEVILASKGYNHAKEDVPEDVYDSIHEAVLNFVWTNF